MVSICQTLGLIIKNKLTILLIMAIIFSSMASARYLPTRNDDYRKERIKDILRMVSLLLADYLYPVN